MQLSILEAIDPLLRTRERWVTECLAGGKSDRPHGGSTQAYSAGNLLDGGGKLHFKNHNIENTIFWSKTWAMYSLLLTHLQLRKDPKRSPTAMESSFEGKKTLKRRKIHVLRT